MLGMLQMKKTYLEASSVLVLSKTLQDYDLNKLDISEAAMRIFTYPWMRRLWTLQEAALSLKDSRIWFRFKGGFMRIRELMRGIIKEFSEDVNRKGPCARFDATKQRVLHVLQPRSKQSQR